MSVGASGAYSAARKLLSVPSAWQGKAQERGGLFLPLPLQGVPWQGPDRLVTPARTDCRAGTVLPMITMAGNASCDLSLASCCGESHAKTAYSAVNPQTYPLPSLPYTMWPGRGFPADDFVLHFK